MDSLIEARKVLEKNIGVVKKPYNFDKLFLKTISFIPYTEFESLYYLRAIPSLYLLGKNYTVLEKDAPIERIFRRLDGNTLIFQ